MGFLDKYAFPNQVVYNVINKEGGGNCAGAAELSLSKNTEKCCDGTCKNKKKLPRIKKKNN